MALAFNLLIALVTEPGDICVSVADNDPRTPILRPAETFSEGGRGMRLVEALALRWGVRRRYDEPGKKVWAALAAA